MTRRTPVPDEQRKRAKRVTKLKSHWLARLSQEDKLTAATAFKKHLRAHSIKDQGITRACWYTKPQSPDEKKDPATNSHLTESKDGHRGIFTCAPWLKANGYAVPEGFKDIVSTVRAAAELSCGGPLQGKQASHICNDARCIRPSHVVPEDGDTNRSRNFCAPYRCHHSPKCLAAGPNAACVTLVSEPLSDE